MKHIRYWLLLGMFLVQSCNTSAVVTPTLEQPSPVPPTATFGQPSPIPATPTVEVPAPTLTPAFEPPVGFQEYRDSMAGISVYIPESWYVTGIVEGQYAILQSYPENKYIGGERFEPGDTKCDLNIHPTGTRASDLIQRWKSDPFTTIGSEQDITLRSGQPGIRIELDNRGRSLSGVTEINDRVIALTCFGDFDPFDEIFVTLMASE